MIFTYINQQRWCDACTVLCAVQGPPASQVAVPLHARYPHPRQPAQSSLAQGGWAAALQSTVAVVELPQPRVLVRCPPGSHGARDAPWQEAAVEGAAPSPKSWDMPAGNLQQGPLVAAGTAAALFGSAAAVLWALYRPEQALAKQRKRL